MSSRSGRRTVVSMTNRAATTAAASERLPFWRLTMMQDGYLKCET
jgi:hypothetical protein